MESLNRDHLQALLECHALETDTRRKSLVAEVAEALHHGLQSQESLQFEQQLHAAKQVPAIDLERDPYSVDQLRPLLMQGVLANLKAGGPLSNEQVLAAVQGFAGLVNAAKTLELAVEEAQQQAAASRFTLHEAAMLEAVFDDALNYVLSQSTTAPPTAPAEVVLAVRKLEERVFALLGYDPNPESGPQQIILPMPPRGTPES